MTKAERNHLNRKAIERAVFTPLAGSIVPRKEVEFRLDIDLKCDGLTDAQVAFLEHVAYNAAHTSVSKAVKLLTAGRNVPQQ
jgi:hypothetical protein